MFESVLRHSQQSLSSAFQTFSTELNRFGGHVVSFFKNIPTYMQENKGVAAAVILSANALFFRIIQSAVDGIKSINHPSFQSFLSAHHQIKRIVFDGLIPGVSAYALNSGLSKVTQYSMSRPLLLAISTAHVAAKILIDQWKISELKKEETSPLAASIKAEREEADRQLLANKIDETKNEIEELTSLIEETEKEYNEIIQQGALKTAEFNSAHGEIEKKNAELESQLESLKTKMAAAESSKAQALRLSEELKEIRDAKAKQQANLEELIKQLSNGPSVVDQSSAVNS